MNEDHKKRGLTHSKLLTAVAISSLLLSSGNVMAAQANPDKSLGVTEQLQAITISGLVVDAAGEPIIGASVVEKGTTNGGITDLNGKFTLTVTPGATLKISFVGYQTQEVKAAKTMRITLKEDTEMLDEVVVVGYGVQKKANLTGAVSTVDLNKTMAGRPQQDVAKALQGAVPGLSILTTSGAIDETASMRIRGLGTLSNGEVSNPLIVVDGVPMDDISFLDTQDIENISVLKDASASSIYGTRAAFGVILINTKSAKPSEKVTINYSNNFAWDQATYLPDYPDVPTQLKMGIEASMNGGAGMPELFGMYFDKLLPYAEKWQQQNGGKTGYRPMNLYQSDSNVGDYIVLDGTPFYYADWDVQDIYFNKAAPSMSHNVSIQGTSGKTNYYLSFGYNEKQGQMKIHPDELKKYNASVNVTTNVYDWLQVGARINYSRKNYKRPDTWANTYQYLWRWGSYFIPSGTIDGYDTRVMAMQKQAADREVTTDLTRMNTFLKAEIVKGLTLNADFTYAIQNMNSGSQDNSVYGINWSGKPVPSYIVTKGNSGIWRDFSKQNTWTANAYVNYTKTFAKKHNLNVMAGVNAEEEEYKYLYGTRNVMYDQEGYPELNMAGKDGQDLSWNHTSRASAGYFGRINYDYKGIYLLELNGRYDGSSRLAPGQKWVLFPSAALAWRVKEESFLKDVDCLSNLKLRLGWGITGNTAIDPYKTQGSLEYGRYSYGSNGVLAFYQKEMPNPNLSWEKTEQWNTGIDFGFLNGRIGGSVDLYLQNTNDLLMDRQLPVVSGFGNIGQIRNKGLEVTLNTVNIDTKDFKWTTDFMFSVNKEEIVELYNGKVDDEGNKWFIGQPVKVFYDYKADGIWQLEDAAELEKWGGVFKPGDIKIVDRNGDYKITSEDRFILGHENPTVTLSMSNYFNYKDFDFSFFLNGAFGQTKSFDRGWSLNGRYNGAKVNYWRIIGEDENGNPISNHSNEAPRPNIDFENPNYISSLYKEDASFLRIGQVTLGYTLPKTLLQTVGIQKLRVYATVQNAYVFTGYSGTDPESGGDFNEPMPRTYLFGVNLSF